ncbi:MAG: hypothetical protein R3192_03095 [Woeseiaceae bacterium]|nr:hypothetical protein [Woeseiaceae bacterium]
MKHVISIAIGFILGIVLFLVGMYFNPFVEQLSVSPLAVTDARKLELTFTAVANEAILYTDHGESNIKPHPDRVAELWEATIKDTRVTVNVLEDSRGQVAGIGIKYATDSERSSLLKSEILVDSTWHLYIVGQGTLFIEQVENHWSYLRDIVIPARWSSGDNWRGTFFRILTRGPTALGTAVVTGGAGNFEGASGEAVESLTASAYATNGGLAAAEGSLTITLSDSESD